jgi:hypothetical protein
LTIFLKFAAWACAGSRSNAQLKLLSQPEDRAARVSDMLGLECKKGHMLCDHDRLLT